MIHRGGQRDTGDDTISALRLARTPQVGPVTYRRLVERFGSAKAALERMPDMARRAGGKPLVPFPLEAAQSEISRVEAAQGRLLVWGSPDYPAMLAVTEDAPAVLTMLGQAPVLQRKCIAIVGSRNASLNGRKFAEKLALELGAAGLTVVSGLARGIDTAAHAASLMTGTIAVLAGGVDVIYPPENKPLYEQIVARGAILAENPFGMQPTAQHFPRRNRIVSGLCLGTVVVEATQKSGSLITAHIAAEQGREVFAVPGHPFDPRASGPNTLIRDGATLVASAQDILDVIMRLHAGYVADGADNTFMPAPAIVPDDMADSLREDIFDMCASTPVAIDTIIAETGAGSHIVNAAILELELAGRLTRHPGGRVSRNPDAQFDLVASAATLL